MNLFQALIKDSVICNYTIFSTDSQFLPKTLILPNGDDIYTVSKFEKFYAEAINEKKYKEAGIRNVGRAGITYLTGWFSGKYRNAKYLPFLLKVTDEVSRMRISGEAVEIASRYGFKMD